LEKTKDLDPQVSGSKQVCCSKSFLLKKILPSEIATTVLVTLEHFEAKKDYKQVNYVCVTLKFVHFHKSILAYH